MEDTTKTKVSLLELENNPQIGMYLVATDNFVLCGKKNLTNEQKQSIEQILNVPLIEFSCFNTELIGVFIQIDRVEKQIFIPEDLYEEEMAILKEIVQKYQYTLIIIDSVNNALGNLISSTKNHIIISHELKSNKEYIEKNTSKSTYILHNQNLHQAGTLIYSVKNLALASSGLGDEELEDLENEIENISTINSGSIYISSGIVANSYGILIGSLSSSVEIQTILESLNYL